MPTSYSSGPIVIERANTLGARSEMPQEKGIARFKSKGPDSAILSEGKANARLSETLLHSTDPRQTCYLSCAKSHYPRRQTG